jgi:hypothetical protein
MGEGEEFKRMQDAWGEVRILLRLVDHKFICSATNNIQKSKPGAASA